MTVIAVLDYGIGNLHSAQKALQHVGADARLTADPGLIRDAAGVVLPGVGNFGRCMEALEESRARRAGHRVRRLGPTVPRRLRRHADAVRGLRGEPRGARPRRAARHRAAAARRGEAAADAVEPARAVRRRASCSPGLPDPAWVYFVHSFAAERNDHAVAVVRLRRPGGRRGRARRRCGPPSSTPRSRRATACAILRQLRRPRPRPRRPRPPDGRVRPLPGDRPARRALRAPLPGRLRPRDRLRRRPGRPGPGVRRRRGAVGPRGRPRRRPHRRPPQPRGRGRHRRRRRRAGPDRRRACATTPRPTRCSTPACAGSCVGTAALGRSRAGSAGWPPATPGGWRSASTPGAATSPSGAGSRVPGATSSTWPAASTTPASPRSWSPRSAATARLRAPTLDQLVGGAGGHAARRRRVRRRRHARRPAGARRRSTVGGRRPGRGDRRPGALRGRLRGDRRRRTVSRPCVASGSSPASTSTPAGWSRASTSSASATPATRSSWRPATTPRAPTSWCSSTSPPRPTPATRWSTSPAARPRRSSSRSPSAAACARSTTPAGCCGPAPTRCRSTPPPSTAPSWWPSWPPSSAPSAWWSPSTPAGAASGGFEVYTHGGRTPTGLDAVEWARRAADARRGRDPAHVDGPRRHQGRLRPRAHPGGHRRRAACPSSPAAASARSTTSSTGVIEGGADAVLAASIFHFGEHTVAEAKDELERAGVIVRPM